MSQPRIFQRGEFLVGNRIELDSTANQHLTRVLRLKQGDEFILFNGQGGEYLARLHLEKRQAFADIIQAMEAERESCLAITLLQGIAKGDHMDFSVQKSVELGVGVIQPVICERTVVNLKADRLDKKMRHWQGIIEHACEQSGRTRLPALANPLSLNQVHTLEQHDQATKLLLDPLAETGLDAVQQQSRPIHLLIGPEGGLTEKEIQQCKESGYIGIRMGQRILRTETAGLAAMAAMQALWGDFRS